MNIKQSTHRPQLNVEVERISNPIETKSLLPSASKGIHASDTEVFKTVLKTHVCDECTELKYSIQVSTDWRDTVGAGFKASARHHMKRHKK